MTTNNKYDVIVIGGGHAGIEASLASAKMKARTLLVTILVEQIGACSCNPAIGGLAKGHLVRELDAIGGAMGLITDECGIQFRTLNSSRGPAVQGSRAQIDMDKYKNYARDLCFKQENLDIKQSTVENLLEKDGKIQGIVTNLGEKIYASKVILTTGTFLDGLIHIGKQTQNGGRFGEMSAIALSQAIKKFDLEIGRLKTGTTPRIDARSIDFNALELHDGDKTPKPFSFRTNKDTFNPTQIPCFVAYTNENTHTLIENNFDKAPIFNGGIDGIGPRYCPSIEDKVNRFRERDRHQVFVEPQTLEANEYYINGLSTSLPIEIQQQFLQTIKGFENVKIVRYGYAIEYDFIQPTQLHHTLELKKINNLYLAGQINGTTGYEEAGAQGFMAGVNAVLSLQNKEPFILGREEAYIGVLIDDLVTKGTKEPYRMFTSRAEYRLLLREESAHFRLSKYGYKYGLLEKSFFDKVILDKNLIDEGIKYLTTNYLTPSKDTLEKLQSLNEEKITDKTLMQDLISRKSFDIDKLKKIDSFFEKFDNEINEHILIESKYARYIIKQQKQISKMKNLINVKIPLEFEYTNISGLSKEVVEKLKKSAPTNLFQASNISGITPAALDILHMFISKIAKQKK